MYFSNIGYLCKETETLDSMRRPYNVYTKKKVFCSSKGVKRNEFYQAQAQGYRPELCVEIKELVYNDETHFEFKGKMYRIVRTYPVKNECLELICQALVIN